MINEMTGKKIEELFNDEAFCQKFEQIKSKEELHKLLTDNDVDITSDDLADIIETGKRALKENGYITEDGELSAELLEMVSGGGWGKRLLKAAVAGGTAVLAVSVGSYVAAGYLIIAAGASLAGY